jgi:hypothetical protein
LVKQFKTCKKKIQELIDLQKIKAENHGHWRRSSGASKENA